MSQCLLKVKSETFKWIKMCSRYNWDPGTRDKSIFYQILILSLKICFKSGLYQVSNDDSKTLSRIQTVALKQYSILYKNHIFNFQYLKFSLFSKTNYFNFQCHWWLMKHLGPESKVVGNIVDCPSPGGSVRPPDQQILRITLYLWKIIIIIATIIIIINIFSVICAKRLFWRKKKRIRSMPFLLLPPSPDTYNWPYLEQMQVAFCSDEEITQVKESRPWVRCASGNVLLMASSPDNWCPHLTTPVSTLPDSSLWLSGLE